MTRMFRAFSIAVAAVPLSAPAVAAPDTVTYRAEPSSGPLTYPCANMPESAVTSVPAPLDRYVRLVCTHGGQALEPLNGDAWMFEQGSMMLSAANADGPAESDHYTELSYKPLSPAELTALQAELAKLQPSAEILTRDILRFAVTTSWGKHKEIYLLPPTAAAGPEAHTVGMECIEHCRPIDKDPWFFTIVPDK
jgi:hypothetical protein